MAENFEFGTVYKIHGKEYRLDHTEAETRELMQSANELVEMARMYPEDPDRITQSGVLFLKAFFGTKIYNEIFDGYEEDITHISQLVEYVGNVINRNRITCPKCGFKMDSTFRYCPNCGTETKRNIVADPNLKRIVELLNIT